MIKSAGMMRPTAWQLDVEVPLVLVNPDAPVMMERELFSFLLLLGERALDGGRSTRLHLPNRLHTSTVGLPATPTTWYGPL